MRLLVLVSSHFKSRNARPRAHTEPHHRPDVAARAATTPLRTASTNAKPHPRPRTTGNQAGARSSRSASAPPRLSHRARPATSASTLDEVDRGASPPAPTHAPPPGPDWTRLSRSCGRLPRHQITRPSRNSATSSTPAAAAVCVSFLPPSTAAPCLHQPRRHRPRRTAPPAPATSLPLR